MGVTLSSSCRRAPMNCQSPFGHPHTEQMRVTERYRRPDLSHLEITITIEDPGAYARPWRINLVSDLRPNVEMQEFICNENNKYQSPVK